MAQQTLFQTEIQIDIAQQTVSDGNTGGYGTANTLFQTEIQVDMAQQTLSLRRKYR